MKLLVNNEQLECIAQAIVNSRELCGNELEAATDELWEQTGILLRHRMDGYNATISAAFTLADNMWRGYQKDAGVAEKHRDGRGGLHDRKVHQDLNHEQ